MFLLIFESIGAPELLVILVVALIIFGPRKLPQLSRTLGKSLADFKRTSDEFKRTWEREVELEETQKDERISQALLPEDNSIIGAGEERSRIVRDSAAAVVASDQNMPDTQSASSDETTAAVAATAAPFDSPSSKPVPEATTAAADVPASEEPTRKRDWL